MAEEPFVVSSELTAVAVAYKNGKLIADDLIPRSPVPAVRFDWTEYPVEDAFEVPDTRVGRRSSPRSIEVSGTEQTARVIDYGLKGEVYHDDEAVDQGKHKIKARTVVRLIGAVELDRERRVAGMFLSPQNYLSHLRLALSGSARFSDPTSDPLSVLKASLDKPLQRPNTVTMGRYVWGKLRSHPRVVKAIKNSFTGEGSITKEQLAAELDVDRVVIGEAQMNVARRGRPMDLRTIWGNAISLTYLEPNFDFASEAMTFAATGQFGTRVGMEYFNPDIGLRGATVVKTGESLIELIIARHAGFLLSNVVEE